MMRHWFVEVKSHGKWHPQKIVSESRPSEKRLGGPDRIFRREPRLLNGDEINMSLDKLQRWYGVKDDCEG